MSQFLFLAGEGIPTAQLGGLLPIVLIFVVVGVAMKVI